MSVHKTKEFDFKCIMKDGSTKVIKFKGVNVTMALSEFRQLMKSNKGKGKNVNSVREVLNVPHLTRKN